jgi:hypothetical protein
MLLTDAARGQRRARREALAVALACAATAFALAALPGDWRLLAVPLALAAGTVVERYRQARRAQPLGLAETPRAWRRTLAALGWRYLLAALAATAAAAGLVGLPELNSDRMRPQPNKAEPGAGRAAELALPAVKTLAGRASHPLRAGGASFTVLYRTAQPWAQSIRARPAARHHIWVAVGIVGRNIHRRRFNPNALAYRLRDARGRLYAPLIGGGTGPASLASTGYLRPGESAQARLAFLVPKTAGHLTLAFEPLPDGSLQARVPLQSRR